VFFLPSGRVHAIGKGILLAEIQQTSDVTYRIFDWNRKGQDGKPRELHNDMAVDAIDFNHYDSYKTDYTLIPDNTSNLVQCNYFTTNLIKADQVIEKDLIKIDSFVIYMCMDGAAEFTYNEKETIQLTKGETILVPATVDHIQIAPSPKTKLLEVYTEIKEEGEQ